jgi:hypothetical protein
VIEYRGYKIEVDEYERFYVCLGNAGGMLYCRTVEEAKTFVDYLIERQSYRLF